jgi:hypothetical protein
MHWYDWMALAIVVAMTIIQTVRGSKAGGMGLPLFEAAGLVVAAVAATAVSRSLAGLLHISEGVVMLVIFLGLSVLAFVVGRWLFTVTGLSFQSLDGFFSFVFGLVAAWAIAHMFLRVVLVSRGVGGELATELTKSPVAREILTFRTWNALMRLLFKAKLGPDFDPDVG